MNIKQVKSKFSKLKIEELAKSSGFQKRKPKKLEIIGFLAGFWMMINKLDHSLSSWSRHIFIISGVFISKQGLDKRLRNAGSFGQCFLDMVVKHLLVSTSLRKRYSKLFCYFSNVYVEDSTCLSLPSNLAHVLPGAFNRFGQSATARIQLRLNLLKDQYTGIELQSFRNNDQKYSAQILQILKKGDLVIRDLGYWSLNVFQKIIACEAYFLTRYKFGVSLFNQKKETFNLLNYLRKADRQGNTIVDLPVLIGKKMQLPARLVAIKAPQNVVLKRKRVAKKNRDRRLNHNKAYYSLLEWTIFITNVESTLWRSQQLFKAYRFRWRIEIIFKAWKSKFKVEHMFKSVQTLNPSRACTTIYLILAMLCLFYNRWYNFFARIVYKETGNEVSPIKFADFVKEHFWELFSNPEDLKKFVPYVAYFFSYEKRKRKSHLELLFNPLS